MGGGARGRRQQAAETTSAQAAETERQRALGLQTELGNRRSLISSGLPESLAATQSGAQNLRDTGGYSPVSPDLTNRGYEGYQEFARTGGYSPEERQQFLRRSSAPISAMYSRAGDQLNRQRALQGGYMPGYTASNSRLLRGAAEQGAEASLGANLELN